MAKPTRHTKKMINEYMAKYWNIPTLSQTIDQNARDYPDKEAIIDGKNRLNWGQMKLWTDRVALSLLELGIKRDEMLVIQLPPCIELYLLRIACEKAGILCTPVLRSFRHREMKYVLDYLEATGVIIPWKFMDIDHFQMIEETRSELPKLKHIIVAGGEVPPGITSLQEMTKYPLENKYPPDYLEGTRYKAAEVSYVNLTTGTTGFPKFVEYTTCARQVQGKAIKEHLGITDKDVVAAFTAAAAGVTGPAYFAAPQAAAKIVLLERFEAEATLKLIEKESMTIVGFVPAMLSMILNHPNLNRYNLRSVRIWWVGGSPLAYQVGKEAEEKMGGTVVNFYGAVDFGGTCTSPLDAPVDVRLLTVGKPIWGGEIKLTDNTGRRVSRGEVGEIYGRGAACAAGYYKDRKGTREAWGKFGMGGWLRLRDLARFDGQGNIVIVGRKDDMIIRGGQNIYPTDIENTLVTHPKVAYVAIVGMPDPILGERPCAYVVPKVGQEFSFDEMISFLKIKGFASYKMPERLEIVDKLPMAGDGQKVNKKILKEDIVNKLKTGGPTIIS